MRYYIFFLVCLYISNTISYFNPTKFIKQLWQKNQQEIIAHDYTVNPASIIELYTQSGDIVIKTWKQNKLAIQATKSGTKEELEATKVSFKSQPQKTIITTNCPDSSNCATVDYAIIVPEKSSIKIHANLNGSITIKHVEGLIDLFTSQGAIKVSGSTNCVIAKNHNGDIFIKQAIFGEPHSIFLESLKGNIFLYIPYDTKANLHARSLHGVVISELPVTLQSKTMKLNKEAWERIKKEAFGTLGCGGAPITLEATKGNITIGAY